jgi:hypothetical protein
VAGDLAAFRGPPTGACATGSELWSPFERVTRTLAQALPPK